MGSRVILDYAENAKEKIYKMQGVVCAMRDSINRFL